VDFLDEEFNVHEIVNLDVESIRDEHGWIGDRIIFEYISRFIVSDNSELSVIDPMIWQIEAARPIPKFYIPSGPWKVIFVPVFREGDHWAMAIFERELCKITFFDSLRRNVNAVQARLLEIWQLAGGGKVPTIVVPPTDTYSAQEKRGCCGVYTCLYAERWLHKKPMLFPSFELDNWRSKAICLFTTLQNLQAPYKNSPAPAHVEKFKRKNPPCKSIIEWAVSELKNWRALGENWPDFELFCENFILKIAEMKSNEFLETQEIKSDLAQDRNEAVPKGIKPRRQLKQDFKAPTDEKSQRAQASRLQKLRTVEKEIYFERFDR